MIRKKTEVIMKVKMRKKIVRKVKRMIQRKEMFSATIWKVLMISVLFKKATTGIYYEKCDITFKSKNRLRRHLIKGHETIGKTGM